MDRKYSVDEIIDDIVLLEDLESKEIIWENLVDLPEEIHDGSIIVFDDEGYHLDFNLEEERKESLRERMERLKNR